MSFPPYPKYKPSGVEWLRDVPEHWEVKRLKLVSKVFPSNVDKKSYDDETPVRLCNYTDVYYNDLITGGLDFMQATATTEQIERFTLRSGDTIITKDSETADDIAISAYVPEHLPGVVCGYHLAMVRPIGNNCGKFIKRYFDSKFARSALEVKANGLTRVGLGQYALDNVDVPLPPPAEQRIIASFLDRETAKIDALVEEQKRLIELLKEKRQAVITQTVTKGLNPDAPMKPSGIEWLGDVPAHWEVKRVKDVIWTIEQGWSPQCEEYSVSSAREWAVLKVGCVNGGVFNPNENKALPAELEPKPDLAIKIDDILISRANTRELVGSVAVSSAEFPNLMLCDKLYRIRVSPMKTLASFLSHFLNASNVRTRIEASATGASSSMLNIGQSVVLELSVGLPPISEQLDIANFINKSIQKIELLISSAVAAIDLLQERRSALISAAVTGKIDVRGVKSSEEAA